MADLHCCTLKGCHAFLRCRFESSNLKRMLTLLPLVLGLSIASPSSTSLQRPVPTCCQAMAELALDPKFIALHEAPEQTDFRPRLGHMAMVAGANDFVVPAKHGSHGAIILVHEWWGLNNQIKQTAERLRRDTGFGVVAIDLYGGKVTNDPQQAGQYMRSVDESKARDLLQATIHEVLRDDVVGASIRKVGTIGYCFGGGQSLQAALDAGQEVQACVMYYGYPELDANRLDKLQAPLLGFFGTQDQGITPAKVDQFKQVLAQDNKEFKIYSYDAPHAFANPSNPHYNKEATADSWKKTVEFFKRNLS